MELKLSKEREHLVLENMGLIRKYLSARKISPFSQKYEDIFSIGMIGLIEAAITFDTTRNINFSTYAYKCIRTAIQRNRIQENRQPNCSYLNATRKNDKTGLETTLMDTIKDSKADFVEKMTRREACIEVINIMLNCLEGRERLSLLYRIAGVGQKEVAENMQISRVAVSNNQTRATKKLYKLCKGRITYDRVFSTEMNGEELSISFLTKDVKDAHKIVEELLSEDLMFGKEIYYFRIDVEEERITICLTAIPQAFFVIARFFQKIEDAIPQEKTISERVIECILTLESFKTQELALYCPDVSYKTICLIIHNAKNRGLIVPTEELGRYIVVK